MFSGEYLDVEATIDFELCYALAAAKCGYAGVVL
jgi:hypothetical protein